MPNRLFYTVKLTSSVLKEYKYNLSMSFEECLKSNYIISLADSQMLKSVRDITGKVIDLNQLEEWYAERDSLKKKKSTKLTRERVKELQEKIYNMMYIPEYITVVMESIKDYERMFKKGFRFNGVLYKRFSCSASQARVSTIVFVKDEIREELKKRLDNGRDLNHELAPSKYNAYFGLYSSAIKEVTKPRFCIIKDFNSMKTVDVDFVIEQGYDEDDIIEPRTMDIEFNRFDGSGLISPQMAKIWGKDLGEKYTPCQFCIRYAFTKGMVNEFDFVEWCKEENNEKYEIEDIYGNIIDLRNIDVILTEGMTKLWDSWDSQEHFEENCQKNKIVWGVTKYSPEVDKNVLWMNYQFLQTLDLDEQMIKDICQDTVDYIQGVSYDDLYYSLLFLLGDGMDQDGIKRYMQQSDNYWLKSLILNHNLLNDKYTKEKIRDFIVKKIEQACLGKIACQGNFSVIVPDSYAFMQWATGQEVTGLLEDGEFYIPYWAEKDEEVIACGRSPMTHFSEWCVVRNKYKLNDEYVSSYEIENLSNDKVKFSDFERVEKIKKYFKYSYSGLITNVHGHYTMNFSGSDFDMDIAATTNSKQVIYGKYRNRRVVTYTAKKPKKKLFTEEDLFTVDTFSFGTKIGAITNCATTICALIPSFEKGTAERELLENRVKMCCSSQSREIDRTKIGEKVKGLATIWKEYQKHTEDETEEEKKLKDFYNSILADKKPYFFKYKYKFLSKEYADYINRNNKNCLTRFGIELKDILNLNEDELTNEQKVFIKYYKKHLPVIDTDCVMNKICKYIEGVDFQIKKKVRSSQDFDYRILLGNNFILNKSLYNEIKEELERTFKIWDETRREAENKKYRRNNTLKDEEKAKFDKDMEFSVLKNKLLEICSNEEKLVNHLIYYYYVDKPSANKGILWALAGKQIYENLKLKVNSYYFPIKNKNGSLKFLYENYSIEKIDINVSDTD